MATDTVLARLRELLVQRAAAWPAQAARLQAGVELLQEPQPVLEALVVCSAAAERLRHAATGGDLELANLAWEREWQALIWLLLGAAPSEELERLLDGIDLQQPLLPTAELGLVRRRTQDLASAWDLTLYGDAQMAGAGEAAVAAARLTRALQRLQRLSDWPQARPLRQELIQHSEQLIQQLRQAESGTPLTADWRSTLGILGLLGRALALPRQRRQLGVVQQVGEIGLQALGHAAGTEVNQVHLLPTFTRAEFRLLLYPQVDADAAQGIYLPALATLVLSPGYSQLLYQPPDSNDLDALHLYELAQAALRGRHPQALDAYECRIANGLAELWCERSRGYAQAAHSEMLQRPLTYVHRWRYPEDRLLVGELERRCGPELLPRLQGQPDLLLALASWLPPGPPPIQLRAQVQSALGAQRAGQPGALDVFSTAHPGAAGAHPVDT